MSSIRPARTSRHCGVTRIPMVTSSADRAANTCTSEVSVPSTWIKAKAKGRSTGCRGVGAGTHAHDRTVPPGPTSNNSGSTDSPVSGSYSSGGKRTRPPEVRQARRRWRRRPSANPPTTGPRVREYGNSNVVVILRATLTLEVEHASGGSGNIPRVSSEWKLIDYVDEAWLGAGCVQAGLAGLPAIQAMRTVSAEGAANTVARGSASRTRSAALACWTRRGGPPGLSGGAR